MLESREFGTISDLATHEKIAPIYMTPVLRLTLLASAIVDAILDSRLVPHVTLEGSWNCFRARGAISFSLEATASRSGKPLCS